MSSIQQHNILFEANFTDFPLKYFYHQQNVFEVYTILHFRIKFKAVLYCKLKQLYILVNVHLRNFFATSRICILERIRQ